MSARCLWCNGAEGELVAIALTEPEWRGERTHVHPEHEASLRSYARASYALARRTMMTILVGLAVAIPGVALAALLGPAAAILALAVVFAAFGGLLFAYPFVGPQIIRWVGVRGSMRVARAAGAALVATGAALALSLL